MSTLADMNKLFIFLLLFETFTSTVKLNLFYINKQWFLKSFQNSRVIIEKIISISNEKYFNVSTSIGSDNSVNITGDAFHTIDDLRVYMTVGLPSENNIQKYERIIFKTTYDVCKLLNGKVGDFLSRTIYVVMKKFANRNVKCPTRVGRYEITSIVIEDDFLPKFLLFNDLRGCVTGKLIGKLTPERKTIEMVTMKFYTRISRNKNN